MACSARRSVKVIASSTATATASRAAAVGGVTTIIVMPNTEPVIDDVALVDFIERRARDTALVNVHPMAAMTRGLAGEGGDVGEPV